MEFSRTTNKNKLQPNHFVSISREKNRLPVGIASGLGNSHQEAPKYKWMWLDNHKALGSSFKACFTFKSVWCRFLKRGVSLPSNLRFGPGV